MDFKTWHFIWLQIQKKLISTQSNCRECQLSSSLIHIYNKTHNHTWNTTHNNIFQLAFCFRYINNSPSISCNEQQIAVAVFITQSFLHKWCLNGWYFFYLHWVSYSFSLETELHAHYPHLWTLKHKLRLVFTQFKTNNGYLQNYVIQETDFLSHGQLVSSFAFYLVILRYPWTQSKDTITTTNWKVLYQQEVKMRTIN